MFRLLCCFLAACLPCVAEVQDPGRREIARVQVQVIHGTDLKEEKSKDPAKPVDEKLAARLRAEERLRFARYRLLGADTQPLLQSYENWAQPLKPSDEILVRFEAQGHPRDAAAVVNLELWLSRKKIFKSVARLEGSKPLFILGPQWRGGRLIISVALAGGADKLGR